MTYSQEQVEWIVAEVLRRLGLVQSEQNSGTGGKTLRVTERVITMGVIDGQLVGIDRLVAQKRAVVTPAVKDELKRRKITLSFEEREH